MFKKVWVKVLTILMIVVICGASVGVGAYFIVRSFTGTTTKPDNNYVEQGPFVPTEESRQVALPMLGGLVIEEHPIINTAYQNGLSHYYLDRFKDANNPANSAFAELESDFNTRLTFGPEITEIKKIYIGELTGSADEDNGAYLPSTQEMFINSKIIESTFDNNKLLVDIARLGGEAAARKAVAESLFQVIFHEYLHHVANVYLNSFQTSDTVNAFKIANNDGRQVMWEKNFYNAFTQTLGYSTPGQLTHFTNTYRYPEKTPADQQLLVHPLSNLYTPQQLFDKANSTDSKAFSELDNNNGDGWSTYGPSRAINAHWPPTNANMASYFWSLVELFPRKMEQALLPLLPNQTYGFINKPTNEVDGTNWTGSIRGADYVVPWTFASDLLRYTDNINSAPFYSDYLFENTGDVRNAKVANLYSALMNDFGYSTGDDIALVYWVNNNHTSDKGEIVIPQTAPTAFKLAGYISDDINAHFIGYQDANNHFHALAPIHTNVFHYQYKERINSTNFVPLDPTKDNVYYVSDAITFNSSLLDKPLFLAEDEAGTNFTLLASANARASSYLAEAGKMANTRILKLINRSVGSLNYGAITLA